MDYKAGHVPVASSTPCRRALILPGGGMRVAYQAGVVKALHDAGLRYSYADGASGGTMNLGALLGGITPDQLCTRWRTLDPMAFVSLRPLATYLRFPAAGALGDFDGFENRIFPRLGIDASHIRRAGGIRATFNVCDFTDKVVVPVPHKDISHELLLAGISLPLATPPVRYRGRYWTDAVWIRDSNLIAAVQAGANELWVAWCIGNTPEYSGGLLQQYVHMIEMAAVGTLNEELAVIADINRRIEAGELPYGHEEPVRVHAIHPEIPIPLDPDFLSGKVDGATLIAYGYRDAMRYLDSMTPQGVPLTPEATKMRDPGVGVSFREVMKGHVTFGETDPVKGSRNPAAVPVFMHGTINVDDIRTFVIDPEHSGELNGHLEIHRAGGWLPSAKGRFGLFSPSDDSALSYMVYDMNVMIDAKPCLFRGRKHVRFAMPWHLWRATTTLYVTLHEGGDPEGKVVGAGVLRLGVPELLSLIGTLHATGTLSRLGRLGACLRFFRFFAAELFRIYFLRRPAK